MRGNSTSNQTTGQQAGRKRSKLRFLVPLAIVLTVAAIACGGSSTSIVGDGASGSGDPAPDFAITMFQGQDVVAGEEVTLHTLVGPKPIVLNFWAGLCPPCRAEMPDLQEFNEKFQDRALTLGIDLGQFTGLGSQDDAQDLLQELEVTYPAGFTIDPDVVRDYKVLGMPTTIFIDTDGNIFNKWTGALNSKILEEKVLEMLAQ